MNGAGIDWTKILVAMLGTGGCIAIIVQAIKEIVMALITRRKEKDAILDELRESVASINSRMECMTEGLSLCLRSDQVIFEAFRNKHINGESEAMDNRIDEYLYTQASEHLMGKGE